MLAQATGIPLPDRVTRESAWELQMAALPGFLRYTWDAGRRDVHNQIRFLRYLKSRAPAASFPIAQAPCQDNFLAASRKIPASHNHHRSRLRRVR